jgi:hypothetical protein
MLDKGGKPEYPEKNPHECMYMYIRPVEVLLDSLVCSGVLTLLNESATASLKFQSSVLSSAHLNRGRMKARSIN